LSPAEGVTPFAHERFGHGGWDLKIVRLMEGRAGKAALADADDLEGLSVQLHLAADHVWPPKRSCHSL
jgi:hypothetical protein